MSLVAKTVFARYSQSLAIQQRAALAVTDINKRERERERNDYNRNENCLRTISSNVKTRRRAVRLREVEMVRESI